MYIPTLDKNIIGIYHYYEIDLHLNLWLEQNCMQDYQLPMQQVSSHHINVVRGKGGLLCNWWLTVEDARIKSNNVGLL